MPEKQPSEKLQKVLANLGLGSRRALEQWIAEGRVKVNGQVATLGDRVTESDRLQVDGRPVSRKKKQRHRTILYNKPTGEVCSRKDPEGRTTVFDRLPKLKKQRWISVGRLDINTSGLLLLTTDGELASRLMHPSSMIEREYVVRILGDVTDEMLQNLRDGVMLEDGMAKFTDIQRCYMFD
ncbi:MAG: rRNA pseudouridine synthase, partial [Pseudomonadales bacterium]|nr:rRNA pseudouridine synthase [Pseudomonadales bacterium]